MAQLDTSIYSNYLAPPKTVEQYDAEANQAKVSKLQLAAQQSAYDQSQRDVADDRAFRNALNSGADDRALLAASPTKAIAYQKARLDNQKTQAETGKFNADAAAKNLEVMKYAANGVMANPTPEAALASLDFVQRMTGQNMDSERQQVAELGGDPIKIKKYAAGHAIEADKLLPHFQTNNTGGSTITQAIDPVTGQAKTVSTLTNTTSPDTLANNDTAIRTTGMNNATSIRTTGMNNATSIATNRANIAKDYKVAGMDGNGNFIVGADGKSPFQGLVDEIGTNQTPQSIALARTAPGIKSQILEEVRKQYPEYDVANFASRNAAIKAYTNPDSKTAQGIQAGNTALNHLDTVKQLAVAQKNGDYQLVNKLFNAIGAQTGNPAPANMQAAIQMVAPEITKAVVGASGGVGERGDFAKSLNGNYAPDQILGVAGTMQDLLGGRLSEVQRTYERTTGRKDFGKVMLSPAAQEVLAKRQAPAGGNAPGQTDIQKAIADELKRRGH